MQQLDQVKTSVYTKILVPLLAANPLLEWLRSFNPSLDDLQKVVVWLTIGYVAIGFATRIVQFIRELRKKSN